MIRGFDSHRLHLATRKGYRTCTRCGRNRAERFFTPRGRTCDRCRKRTRSRGARAPRLMELYGITLADYDDLLAAQGGACAICGGKRAGNLDVDHDHALERAGVRPRDCVRGLLCKRCNRRLLPAAQDKTERLLAAIAYLQRPPAQAVLRGED